MSDSYDDYEAKMQLAEHAWEITNRIKENKMSREAMKHTPGPWYIDPIKAHANGNRRIMAEQCTPVAVVPEHLAADARLIAAAPDLLALAERIARLPEHGHYLALIDEARAAIAKTTGEKS